MSETSGIVKYASCGFFCYNSPVSLYAIFNMSNPARKRAYRHRVICSECGKEIVAEYQDAHAKTKHKGKKVKFTVPRAPNQSQLGFTNSDEAITSMPKCRKIDAQNVGSDLQTDSGTNIVVSSDTDTAPDNWDKSEIEVNNGVTDVGVPVPDESEIMDNGSSAASASDKLDNLDLEMANYDAPDASEGESVDLDTGADNSAPDMSEIVDNGRAKSEIVGSAKPNRDMSVSVIMENGAPEPRDKSDLVDGAPDSSLDTNLYGGTCKKSGDIDEGP